MLLQQQKKVDIQAFKPLRVDFEALLVVYKTQDGWRGFAHPYGETTEGATKDETLKKLRALTSAYYEAVKKYGFPSHLVNGHLDDLQDRYVFNQVVGNRNFMEGVHSQEGRADSENCYVETYGSKS